MSETINFKTGWLKDPADNQKFAPKTTTNQVLTVDGERLTTLLNKAQTNPEFENSVSMGRLADSTVGERSVALGTDVQAISPNSVAMGERAIAGCKGYYIVGISSRPNTIEIAPFTSKLENSAEIGKEFIGENYIPAGTMYFNYDVIIDYEVGDKISIKTGYKPYLDCATITHINGNFIEYEGTLPTFTKDESHSGNTLFVVRKPDCGVVNLFNSAIALGGAGNEEELGNVAAGSQSLVAGRNNIGMAYSFTSGAHNIAGYGATAEGMNNNATGDLAHVEGSWNSATGYAAHVEGDSNSALGGYSHAEGQNTYAGKAWSHAEGKGTVADGFASHAEGKQTSTSAEGAHSEGIETYANGVASHTEGHKTTTEKSYGHAEGLSTISKEEAAHAEGENTIASGRGSHAEGGYLNSNGTILSTEAKGTYSHAEGMNTHANASYSHTEGAHTEANGEGAHAEGNSSKAIGVFSHAEGLLAKSTGGYSHAEGDQTESAGVASHAEGTHTKATKEGAHAEGSYSEATGKVAHAEGQSTFAVGDASHSEGQSSEANGKYSHAEGLGSVANGEAQHAQGKYNIKDTANKYAHIVGNGDGPEDFRRSNAHTLDWDGNAWFKGDIYVGSTSGINKDDGSRKLATEDFVNSVSIGKAGTAEGAEIFNNYSENKASGAYSHAEGNGTTTLGANSHAEGSNTYTYEEAVDAHVEGTGTVATRQSQHVEGFYNQPDNRYIHILGNGSATKRENAHTIHEDGTPWFKKDIYVGGFSQFDTSAAVKVSTAKDLENYYLKTETYNKDEIKDLTDKIPKFKLEIVIGLPTSDIDETTIYLVPNNSTDDGANKNFYTEYIYKNGRWEILGEQKLDLSGYVTTENLNNTILPKYELANDASGKLGQAKDYTDALRSDIENGDVTAASATSASKAVADQNNKVIDQTYETIENSGKKLEEAKDYTDTLSNNLINGSVLPKQASSATADSLGNAIHTTYETKVDANNKYKELTNIITETSKAQRFVAIYGQTSFNDLKEAHAAGRSLVVLNDYRDTNETLQAGLYDADDNLLYSWQELLDMDIEYEELEGMTDEGTNNWVSKTGKCLTVENGVLNSIVTYSASTHTYTNPSRDALGAATKLVVDESVTSIGPHGLAAFHIKEIILPSTLVTISDDAFSHIYDYNYFFNHEYATIYIPKSVTYISGRAFYESSTKVLYEGTDEEFNNLTTVVNAYEFSYVCDYLLTKEPIYSQLTRTTASIFVFRSHESDGDVEYECSKQYGWATKNIKAIKIGDAQITYDYDNQRIVFSFPPEGAVG